MSVCFTFTCRIACAPMTDRFCPRPSADVALWQALVVWLLGSLLAAQSVDSWLSSRDWANQFVSTPTWVRLASWFSTKAVLPQSDQADIEFLRVLPVVAAVHLATWVFGTLGLSIGRIRQTLPLLSRWGAWGGVWWCLVGAWDWGSVALSLLGWEWSAAIWGLIPSFWCAGCLAGWMTTWLLLWQAPASANRQAPAEPSFPPARHAPRPAPNRLLLWAFVAAYVVVFVTMNWRLYFNLLIPHGDSAMYEEHLWNLLHGKGFRSYLDQGLFLGEHIQVVHLALIPIYALFPSHLTLEFCESLALALGAWPVYWMVRRHADSPCAALAAAVAYLLYSPMQFLDIEIDFKTFRPEAFGIPILLMTLDQLDRRRLWGTAVGMLGCLAVKEDYAMVLAPLGAWIAVRCGLRNAEEGGRAVRRRWLVFGVLTAVLSVAYLYVATRVVMPYFRSGAEIHYASYFSRFGQTPEQIIRTMITRPGLVLEEFFSASTFLYALMMLVPLAFVPLLSPGRLVVGLPLFGILSLNELARDPRHHFHAPLVPIVFWALAGAWPLGVRSAARLLQGVCRGVAAPATVATSALPHLVWTSSFAMGLFFSMHPLSLPFWDSGSTSHWRNLYGPSRRAEEFAKIADLIPRSARVASTDFVHPRYTHHERSYDYSDYRRKVSDYQAKVPDDTDYIVIDTQHRYSKIKSPADVPEYRDHSDIWELLPDQTNGYFIVLKRRK
jgi:uncharacterized membrane protein